MSMIVNPDGIRMILGVLTANLVLSLCVFAWALLKTGENQSKTRRTSFIAMTALIISAIDAVLMREIIWRQ